MRKQPRIRSKYNPREVFSFEKTPGEFKSVTEKSIDNIKEYCIESINKNYKGSYDAGALYAMARTLLGSFDLLASKLKEDYSCRRKKLKKAQNLGIEDVNKRILQFEKTVAEYKMVLKRYNDNLADYAGYQLDEDLQYPKERLQEFKNRLKKIEEKNHEA